MPPKPTWFHRLPEILDGLRGMDSSHLDRQAVEQHFDVGERRSRFARPLKVAGRPRTGRRSGVLLSSREWL